MCCVCAPPRRREKKNGSLLLGPTSNFLPVCDMPRIMEGRTPNADLGVGRKAFHRKDTEVTLLVSEGS